MASVFVSIPVAAAWPSAEELDARDAVIAAVGAAAAGTCTGSGGGLGVMDFSYRVADPTAARAAIERAMAEHLPGVQYQLHVEE